MPEIVRLTFDITKETHEKLNLIPYGLRKYTYQTLIEIFAELLAEDPGGTMQILLRRRMNKEDMLGKERIKQEEEEEKKNKKKESAKNGSKK